MPRMVDRLPCCLAAFLVLVVAGSLRADTDPGEANPEPSKVEFFRAKVEPILRNRCLKCHGGEVKIRGGLRLDSRAAILEGGDQGPAVALDRPEQSLILQAIRFEGLEMPPSGKLPGEEIAALDRWIREGMTWTGAADTSKPVVTANKPSAKPKENAAPKVVFHAVARPPVPSVRHSEWVRSPIDAFLLAKLEAEGLSPVGPADRVAWIRRVSYDLTGLPPTPEDVDAYLGDLSVDADARLVDRLLASPRYGEAWGRHWLDLVRYAETNGYERDGAKPFAWRYRDYVIRAFNDDKPYDQFLHEQLAGDEIDPTSVEAMAATGFYRLGLWDDEPVDRPQARYDGLDGIVSTTGQVFLGLSINCARCHDHKKDPIPQADYYRLMAFFHDVTHPDGKDLMKVGPSPGVSVMCVRERGQAETHVLLRGNPSLPGPVVEPGTPAMLGDCYASFTRGAGKRRALADWLTDRRNPMTARVMANRLWQFHFGRGIVPTPNDFGALGEPATHPELLDWLAAELMDGGWTLKRMHRLIVLSSAYRMSSHASEQELTKDPGNHTYWRFPMRRLSGEEVRDSILAVSGVLNDKAGGPSICPSISAEVLAGQSVPGQGWEVSPPREAARRSVYVHVKRSLSLPILETHDAPDTDSSCPVRYTTTVPSQALGLLNGEFANTHAALLAKRLVRERPGSLNEQVRRAIRLCTGAEPPAEEIERDVEWIRSLEHEAHLDTTAALQQYSLLSLSANAFLYLD